MDNVSREIDILRKNQKEGLEIKNTNRNAIDGLINRLDMAEKRISELEDIIETSKTEKQGEKKPTKKPPEYARSAK